MLDKFRNQSDSLKFFHWEFIRNSFYFISTKVRPCKNFELLRISISFNWFNCSSSLQLSSNEIYFHKFNRACQCQKHDCSVQLLRASEKKRFTLHICRLRISRYNVDRLLFSVHAVCKQRCRHINDHCKLYKLNCFRNAYFYCDRITQMAATQWQRVGSFSLFQLDFKSQSLKI
jgi:hypothetical protein